MYVALTPPPRHQHLRCFYYYSKQAYFNNRHMRKLGLRIHPGKKHPNGRYTRKLDLSSTVQAPGSHFWLLLRSKTVRWRFSAPTKTLRPVSKLNVHQSPGRAPFTSTLTNTNTATENLKYEPNKTSLLSELAHVTVSVKPRLPGHLGFIVRLNDRIIKWINHALIHSLILINSSANLVHVGVCACADNKHACVHGNSG